jgi:adenylate cyclase
MTDLEALQSRRELSLVISFLDLSKFTSNSARMSDAALAERMDLFYERVASHVKGAGGVLVKFIGDAALAVWSEDCASEAVLALFALKDELDAWLREQGWDSELVVKAHAGTAIAGPFGARDAKRFDVLGQAVNFAASIEARTFSVSPELFRKLSAEARQRFKKHTPRVVYIPVADRRPR